MTIDQTQADDLFGKFFVHDNHLKRPQTSRPYAMHHSTGNDNNERCLASIPRVRPKDLKEMSIQAFGRGWMAESDPEIRNFVTNYESRVSSETGSVGITTVSNPTLLM